jgi:hypothetical protein
VEEKEEETKEKEQAKVTGRVTLEELLLRAVKMSWSVAVSVSQEEKVKEDEEKATTQSQEDRAQTKDKVKGNDF